MEHRTLNTKMEHLPLLAFFKSLKKNNTSKVCFKRRAFFFKRAYNSFFIFKRNLIRSIQILRDLSAHIQYLENAVLRQGVRHTGHRVGDEEFLEAAVVRPLGRKVGTPGLVGEDCVGDEGADAGGSCVLAGHAAVVDGAA